MKKISRPQAASNKRNNRRVVMVKSISGRMRTPAGKEEDFRAQLINVSWTGAQVYSNKAIDDRSSVDLELDSLDGSHKVVYKGKVVWARKNPMKAMGRFAYGIHFDKVSTEQVKFLENNYSLSEIPTE